MGKTLDKLLNVGKKLIVGTAIAMSTFFPNKLNAQYPEVLNRLNRPNEVVDKYGSYGSGDVDQDGDIDNDDLMAMNTTQNFYSDVDGDGIQSSELDKQHLTDFLNNTIPYLQGDYGALQTPEERKSWISKIYPIMTTLNNYEFIPTSDPRSQNIDTRFDSDNGGIGDYLTGNGYNPNRDDFNDIHPKYNLDYNGLFNLPFCDITVTSDSGFAHTLSGLLIGDNITDTENIVFTEPQEGRIVEPGKDWSIPYDSRVYVSAIRGFAGLSESDGAWEHPLMRIYIDGVGNRILTWQNPELVQQRISLDVENDNNSKLEGYTLSQNYPNPFNSNTTISYTLPKDDNVSLKIFDLKGNELETLVNKKQNAGEHKINWNSSEYPSGTYFYRLQTPTTTKTKKMTYVK